MGHLAKRTESLSSLCLGLHELVDEALSDVWFNRSSTGHGVDKSTDEHGQGENNPLGHLSPLVCWWRDSSSSETKQANHWMDDAFLLSLHPCTLLVILEFARKESLSLILAPTILSAPHVRPAPNPNPLPICHVTRCPRALIPGIMFPGMMPPLPQPFLRNRPRHRFRCLS